MASHPILNSLEQFLFEVPLYAPMTVQPLEYDYEGEDHPVLDVLYSFSGKKAARLDGYCPFCHRNTTFTVNYVALHNLADYNNLDDRNAIDRVSITCVRSDEHVIRYWYHLKSLTIEKVGQMPSLATVANDQVASYRRQMDTHDSQEFHKAIGLAAHGVGVGSFVYLRRVFERLIYRRFEEFKKDEQWSDSDFYGVRMEDKIALLRGHLPDFLVENRKVYAILSIGIHELDEDACLSYFEAMKQAIIIILEDDKKKREELERRATFARAIASFQPPEKMDGATE